MDNTETMPCLICRKPVRVNKDELKVIELALKLYFVNLMRMESLMGSDIQEILKKIENFKPKKE